MFSHTITHSLVLPPMTSIHHMEPLRAHGHADARMVTTATPADSDSDGDWPTKISTPDVSDLKGIPHQKITADINKLNFQSLNKFDTYHPPKKQNLRVSETVLQHERFEDWGVFFLLTTSLPLCSGEKPLPACGQRQKNSWKWWNHTPSAISIYQLRSVWVDDTFILYTEPERLPTRFRILCNLVPIKTPSPGQSERIWSNSAWPNREGGNNQNPWSPEDFGHFFDGILLNLGDIKPFNMVIPLHRRLGSSWNADTLPGCLGPRYLPWNQGGGCV